MTVTKRLFTELSKSFRSISLKANTASRLPRPSTQSANSNAKQTRFAQDAFRTRAPPRGRILLAAFAGGSAVSILVGVQPSTFSKPKDVKEKITENSGSESEFRKIRIAEVKQHDASSGRPWVTKGRSVYDITEWVGAHPGGDVILRAAGGSIDPYWNIFSIHKRQDVYDILEQYLVGEIDPIDLVDDEVPVEDIEDPFSDDPTRDPRLRVLTAHPCNAETPGEGLSEFLTPNDLFYVRNHMWVPVVKEPEHRLTIELPDGEEKSYTMHELKERFKKYKITATLQCAGNRRKDMTDHAKQTNGLQWTAGAISSAEWEGIKLRDVLADAGLDLQNVPEDAQHAQFTGLEAYGASIPISKAIDPYGDVILAFKMNGEDLPRDHGFPLRVIVPGNVAARSVKWLRRIVISDEESLSQWQRRDYKCFGPNVGANPDWSKAKSIQEMPVTSAITAIRNASQDRSESAPEVDTSMSVEGYAYSGGGREIVRVDISLDNGETWDQAELLDDCVKGSKAWCWKRWRYNGLKPSHGKTTVLVKAIDEAYNTQPESYEAIYNVRGNLATAWHSVTV
jgi:sulfite oxidase